MVKEKEKEMKSGGLKELEEFGDLFGKRRKRNGQKKKYKSGILYYKK